MLTEKAVAFVTIMARVVDLGMPPARAMGVAAVAMHWFMLDGRDEVEFGFSEFGVGFGLSADDEATATSPILLKIKVRELIEEPLASLEAALKVSESASPSKARRQRRPQKDASPKG
jgi:hypothetical protein